MFCIGDIVTTNYRRTYNNNLHRGHTMEVIGIDPRPCGEHYYNGNRDGHKYIFVKCSCNRDVFVCSKVIKLKNKRVKEKDSLSLFDFNKKQIKLMSKFVEDKK